MPAIYSMLINPATTHNPDMNSTHFKWEYAQRSSAYELPDDIELVLENDYVKNAGNYTDEIFKQIQLFSLISPNASASEILEFVRSSC